MFTGVPSRGSASAAAAADMHTTGEAGVRSGPRPPGPQADRLTAGAPQSAWQPEALAQQILNSAATQGAWTTGNVQMDDWMRNNIDDDALLLRFARIPVPERMDIAGAIMKRASSITNLTQYFAGCINKALNKPQSRARPGPYRASGEVDDSGARPPLPSPLRSGSAAGAADSPVLTSTPTSPAASIADGWSFAMAAPSRRNSAASTASSQGRLPASLPALPATSQISTWAMEALKEAHNKSRFLSKVCRQLDTATCQELQSLSPAWMYNIAMAVTLGCRNGVNANMAARQCLQSHADCGSPGLGSGLQRPPAQPVLHLIVVHFGAWHSFSQLALQTAMRFAASELQDVSVDVSEVHVFPSSEMAMKVEEAVVAAMQWRTKVWATAKEMVPLVIERSPHWASQNAKVLFLTRQDMPSDQRSFTDLMPPPTVLHGDAMHVFWRHLAAVRCIAKHTGNSNIAQFFLTSSTLQESTEEPVRQWLGQTKCLDPLKYKAPLAAHKLYMSPDYPDPSCRCAAWDPTREVNGWRWAAGSQQPAADLPSYRMHGRILSLQRVVVFRERELLAEEMAALQMARAVHSSSGHNGYLPVELHASMTGCQDLPVAELMRQVSPCWGYVHPATGMAVSSDDSHGEVCGQFRWCAACEEIHEALFALPHLRQLSDNVAAWLGVCLQVWAGKETRTFAEADSCPEHECTDACLLALN